MSVIADAHLPQRTIEGTYTIPTLESGVTAVNMYITVQGWQSLLNQWSLPLTYTVPATGSYAITVTGYSEYQLEGHYDVNDGRLSPDSPITYAN